MRRRHALALPHAPRRGHDNVGIVLQAYLERTLHDIADLRDLRPSVRLCKGIYVEPASIAFRDADVVRRSFVRCPRRLARGRLARRDRDPRRGLARRVARARRGARPRRLRVPDAARRARGPRDELVAAGHPLRVYVPYGQRWYEYSLRRLQENPQMAGVIAKATMARALRRGYQRPAGRENARSPGQEGGRGLCCQRRREVASCIRRWTL